MWGAVSNAVTGSPAAQHIHKTISEEKENWKILFIHDILTQSFYEKLPIEGKIEKNYIFMNFLNTCRWLLLSLLESDLIVFIYMKIWNVHSTGVGWCSLKSSPLSPRLRWIAPRNMQSQCRRIGRKNYLFSLQTSSGWKTGFIYLTAVCGETIGYSTSLEWSCMTDMYIFYSLRKVISHSFISNRKSTHTIWCGRFIILNKLKWWNREKQ